MPAIILGRYPCPDIISPKSRAAVESLFSQQAAFLATDVHREIGRGARW
jgi:hypothetical protein